MKLYITNGDVKIGDLYSSLMTTSDLSLAKVMDGCERTLRLQVRNYKCTEWSEGTCAQVFAGLVESNKEEDWLLLMLMCMQGRHILTTIVVSFNDLLRDTYKVP